MSRPWSRHKVKVSPESKAARRCQRMASQEIISWSQIALGTVGDALNHYDRYPSHGAAVELRTAAEALHALSTELTRRDSLS